ncbi:cation transport ATPase [Staphylococcus hominis]
MRNKKNMDERQEIINKNMLIRSFGVLFILLVMYIILLSFINISQVAYQLILIGILTLTSIYMWIDSFISRILYYDVKNNKDIKTKIVTAVITLLMIDIVAIILSNFKMIDIEITIIFLVTLLGINICLLSIYYIVLKLWTIWYR